MKTLATMALWVLPALGSDCFKMDSLILQTPPPCRTGTCKVAIAQDNIKGLFVQQFLATGHNACKDKKTGQGPAGASVVVLGFYDKSGTRLGIGTLYVASLDPGEKFRHLYEVPGDVIASGKPASIKVKAVEDKAE